MTSQNLAFVSMALENKLNEHDKFLVSKQCENLDDDFVSSISSIATAYLKSPFKGLLCQLFLGIFGVGRFYKGKNIDILLGILC